MDGALRSDKACRCNQRSRTPLVIHRATAKQSLSQSSPNLCSPWLCAVGLSEISLCKLCGKDEFTTPRTRHFPYFGNNFHIIFFYVMWHMPR